MSGVLAGSIGLIRYSARDNKPSRYTKANVPHRANVTTVTKTTITETNVTEATATEATVRSIHHLRLRLRRRLKSPTAFSSSF